MRSGETVSLGQAARRLIREAIDGKKLNPSNVATRIGVHRSTVWSILKGRTNPSRSNLIKLAAVLDLDLDDLQLQYELFQIDDAFAQSAHDALDKEIGRLRKEVGRVRALSVSGTVGVHFHGITPNRKTFERVFAVPAPRMAS